MEDHERPAYELMMWELGRLDLWLQRLDGDGAGFQVGPGSDLSSDDATLQDYALSHAGWSALSHAVDHLHMVRHAVRDGEVVHLFAPYSLLRAAIENAATAVWLLAPDSSAERVTRRLRQAAGDIIAGEDVKVLIQQPGPRSRAERLDDLRMIANANGIDPGIAVKPAGFRSIVRVAGAEVHAGADLTQILWHVGSGVAHGDLWTTLTVPNRVEVAGSNQRVANLRLTAGMNSLATMVLVATELTSKGWELFDLRRKDRSVP